MWREWSKQILLYLMGQHGERTYYKRGIIYTFGLKEKSVHYLILLWNSWFLFILDHSPLEVKNLRLACCRTLILNTLFVGLFFQVCVCLGGSRLHSWEYSTAKEYILSYNFRKQSNFLKIANYILEGPLKWSEKKKRNILS